MAVAAALILADATRNADTQGGRFLDRALAIAEDLSAKRCEWSRDEYLGAALAPVTDDVGTYLSGGVAYMLHDCLRSAAAKLERLRVSDPTDFGDPCVDVGEGWEAASAVALALLVADLATGPDAPLDGGSALGWA